MRLLLVNSLYQPHELGGAERVVRFYAEAFAMRGHEVTVACLAPKGEEGRAMLGGVRIVRLPLANLYWPFTRGLRPSGWRRAAWHLIDDRNPVMGRRLAGVMAEVRPHVVNLHNIAGFSSALYAKASAQGVPIVQTLHDYYFACPRTAMFRDGRNCPRPCRPCHVLTRARRRASGRADLVIGVSNAVLETLHTHGAFTRARQRLVLHNPCAPTEPPPRPRPDYVAGRPLRLGFIGRLDPSKGLETVLAALRSVADLPVSLLVAGSGPPGYTESLRRAAGGLPVLFMGHVPPDDVFARVDLLVVPSAWREPFPRVIQEALVRGVPVIGAASGGIPEELGPACADLLFPRQDEAALASLLRRLVQEGTPMRAWSEACLLRASAFAPDPIVDELLDRFANLAGVPAHASTRATFNAARVDPLTVGRDRLGGSVARGDGEAGRAVG